MDTMILVQRFALNAITDARLVLQVEAAQDAFPRISERRQLIKFLKVSSNAHASLDTTTLMEILSAQDVCLNVSLAALVRHATPA